MARQVVLDTETTGLEPSQGHRIIEIGAVELIDRKLTGRHYHQYLQPDREIDEGAMAVHGITPEFLEDKPRFVDVVDDFLSFIKGAELIIHNAAFDVGFINHELKMLDPALGSVLDHCTVMDTLLMARQLHPGQKNNLDALCRRYDIDNSRRELHGALLDSEILADVYLAMTGGQVSLSLGGQSSENNMQQNSSIRRVSSARSRLRVIQASPQEMQEHESRLDVIDKASGGSVWRRENDAELIH